LEVEIWDMGRAAPKTWNQHVQQSKVRWKNKGSSVVTQKQWAEMRGEKERKKNIGDTTRLHVSLAISS
jgi:hypothetical protein